MWNHRLQSLRTFGSFPFFLSPFANSFAFGIVVVCGGGMAQGGLLVILLGVGIGGVYWWCILYDVIVVQLDMSIAVLRGGLIVVIECVTS